ncbi:MAG: 3-deoxy-D-manno-octulosonic acid transferase [Betaproteobacteria bacterium]|nr:3-deoxy-D-manno-octulosonic acid transferase [Betaproteobacteria bacterium]
MLRALYSLMLFVATPLIVVRLLWRGLKQPDYRRHWGERWGMSAIPALEHSIWIHAVSVGEMRAAQPLVKRLQTEFDDYPIVITCMTPTGRATAAELYGDSVTCRYLPYDFFTLHRRLIAQLKPKVLLVMETEIWPNLLAACATEAVPALLVNARMSEKSARGYGKLAPVRILVKEALGSLHIVAAQTAEDASRLATLGAKRTAVTGNVKFDMPIDPALIAIGKDWRRQLMGKKVLLAASTRDGEEALLIDGYLRAFSAAERDSILFVVVPRHPQRFDDVARLLTSGDLKFSRRSSAVPSTIDQAWLGDSMGEMAAYIAMADVVFVGGSLLPLGGQNLIEACAQGKPVLMGPSTFNFADASKQAIAAGGMLQAADADGVMRLAGDLLKNAAKRDEMGAAALAFARAHAGATEKTMGLIAPLLTTPR